MKHLFLIFFPIFFGDKISSAKFKEDKDHNYYFSNNGDDRNDGSLEHPFKTIAHFNSQKFNPGDSLFFKAGDTFNGNIILDSTKSGNNEKPVVITSYWKGNTVITNANQLTSFNNYKITASSSITKSGIDLQSFFGINIGSMDFNGEPINKKCLGTCTHP